MVAPLYARGYKVFQGVNGNGTSVPFGSGEVTGQTGIARTFAAVTVARRLRQFRSCNDGVGILRRKR
jgi:hypothetical protein